MHAFNFKYEFESSLSKILNCIQDPQQNKLYGIDVNSIEIKEKTLNKNYKNYKDLELEKFARIHSPFHPSPILNLKKIEPFDFANNLNNIESKTNKFVKNKKKLIITDNFNNNKNNQNNKSLNSSNAISIDKNDLLNNNINIQNNEKLQSLKITRNDSKLRLHRHEFSEDIKPSNNIVTGKLDVKIFDLSKNFLKYKTKHKNINEASNINKAYKNIINNDKNNPGASDGKFVHNANNKSDNDYKNFLSAKFSNKLINSNLNKDNEKNYDYLKIIPPDNVDDYLNYKITNNYNNINKYNDYLKEAAKNYTNSNKDKLLSINTRKDTDDINYNYIKPQNLNWIFNSNKKDSGQNTNPDSVSIDLSKNKLEEEHEEKNNLDNLNNNNNTIENKKEKEEPENNFTNKNLILEFNELKGELQTKVEEGNLNEIPNKNNINDRKELAEHKENEALVNKDNKLHIKNSEAKIYLKRKTPSVKLNNKISIIDTQVISSVYNPFKLEVNEKLLKLQTNKMKDIKFLFRKIKDSQKKDNYNFKDNKNNKYKNNNNALNLNLKQDILIKKQQQKTIEFIDANQQSSRENKNAKLDRNNQKRETKTNIISFSSRNIQNESK